MIQKKNWQDQLPTLTMKILREHYNRNLPYVMSFVAEDISWIGPLECQYLSGKAAFQEMLLPEQAVPISVSNMEFHLVHRDEQTCVVAGRLLASTPAESELLLSVWQRYTVAWRLREGKAEMIHIHASNPWEYVQKGETFPFHMGRLARAYMKKMCREAHRSHSFRDISQREIYLEEKQIIYVEANGKNCTIHFHGGKFEVHTSISAIEKLFSSQFYRIHRGFLVNIRFVVRIQRYELLLCDGLCLPIPEKKYAQVRQDLHRLKNCD